MRLGKGYLNTKKIRGWEWWAEDMDSKKLANERKDRIELGGLYRTCRKVRGGDNVGQRKGRKGKGGLG